MRLFHVAYAEYAAAIDREGLRSNPRRDAARPDRTAMRQALDERAHARFDEWVPRDGAGFAWADREWALDYAAGVLEPTVLVTFDAPDRTWYVDRYYVEEAYAAVQTSGVDSDTFEEMAERVLQAARPGVGDGSNPGREVWFQPPVGRDRIHAIESTE
jgi:hypothetical protein